MSEDRAQQEQSPEEAGAEQWGRSKSQDRNGTEVRTLLILLQKSSEEGKELLLPPSSLIGTRRQPVARYPADNSITMKQWSPALNPGHLASGSTQRAELN